MREKKPNDFKHQKMDIRVTVVFFNCVFVIFNHHSMLDPNYMNFLVLI